MFDSRKALGDDGNVGVRAFGGGGADGLIRAIRAGVALSCVLRFRSWAVLGFGGDEGGLFFEVGVYGVVDAFERFFEGGSHGV